MLKVKEWNKHISWKYQSKKLVSDKVDLRAKKIPNNDCIVMRGTAHKDGIPIGNAAALNIKSSKYMKQNMRKNERRIRPVHNATPLSQ